MNDPLARAGALSEIEATGPAAQAAVLALLEAGASGTSGEDASLAQLDALAANPDVTQAYRDLAALTAVMVAGEALSPQDRITRLQPLALPGAPYALLASEQIAMAHIDQGNTDLAIEILQGIAVDNAVTADLRTRAAQVIGALGGTIDQ